MRGKLARPDKFFFEGLEVPRLFYPVLTEPALLAGMSYPGQHVPWRKLYDIGIGYVICLCCERVEYDPAPVKQLLAVEMEDLHHGNEPRYPARNEKLVRQAVERVNACLEKSEGVAIHCVGGTGRTGTVIGCVLRSRGFTADETIRYLDEVNKLRGRRGWPEAPWQAEMVRRF